MCGTALICISIRADGADSLDIALSQISKHLTRGADSMTVPKRDWLDLCAAVANEKDSKNLGLLVQELIRALDDRQAQSRTQVPKRLDLSAPKRTGCISMNIEKWEEVYRLAVLEVEGERMPERISTAREAIAGRLQEIEGGRDHHEERNRLEHALTALKMLTIESQGWR